MNYEVIIVGGGPVGMTLAGELALAGVKNCVLERLKSTISQSRALTAHPRTLEQLDLRGLKDKLNGKPLPTGHFAALDTRLDFSVLKSSSNYTLYIPQHDTEKVLEEWAISLGADIRREVEVISVGQDEEGVAIVASGTQGEFKLTANYLVGADGARSLVRKQAGIPFTGTSETLTGMLGDVELDNPPEFGVLSSYNEYGQLMVVPMAKGMYRIVLIDAERKSVPKEEPVTFEELRSSVERMIGNDLGMRSPSWLSRYGNATLQADRYREGRIFLVGDAAHIHFPAGGQGMNVGIQEAVNLGWKLAAALRGWAPKWLLDSYHNERFPINTALLKNTIVQTFLMGGEFSPRMIELRAMLSDLLQVPEANAQLAAQISAFNIRYETDNQAPEHPLNGVRFPALNLHLDGGTCSAYDLFRAGGFVLLNFVADEGFEQAIRGLNLPHVQIIRASIKENYSEWKDVHTALIRPDGYVAWAISHTETQSKDIIKQGIHRWCGEYKGLLTV
ncbi:monooxygenase [Paenibacillus sp. WQ 127069]|uniref:Monooxygenase n=1 Tax=Paenibacillus baimaensis TaxID=2982185 RepID=A0ABT2UIN0_9BACL|nr:monooxygenase [Paenibacillus sp. WQ 127069]MCU6794482.1 monooxygenase [Paenibacillus sp. WQ 127069]